MKNQLHMMIFFQFMGTIPMIHCFSSSSLIGRAPTPASLHATPIRINAIGSSLIGRVPTSVSSSRACAYSSFVFHATPIRINEIEGPILDMVPSDFQPLFSSTANATLPRTAVTGQTAHDPFRYEWGTWVDDDALETLITNINHVRVANREVFDKLVSTENNAVRYRVGSGQDWDVILHVLPADESWRGRWPTGSWSILKTLIGTTEFAALRGPNRDGVYTEMTKKSLRGGGDGTLAGGASSAGADCIKYVGGPLRQYTGKAAKTILLEVVIRPPIGSEPEEMEDLPLNLAETLSIVIPEEDEEEEEQQQEDDDVSMKKTLGAAMGMEFEQVGGLDNQLDAIARRVLASRANPEAARRLGVSHVRGILLSGPPGCGKTLLARELAQILGAREPQIVNGPGTFGILLRVFSL
jgi:hypothetical protein